MDYVRSSDTPLDVTNKLLSENAALAATDAAAAGGGVVSVRVKLSSVDGGLVL